MSKELEERIAILEQQISLLKRSHCCSVIFDDEWEEASTYKGKEKEKCQETSGSQATYT